MALVPNFVERLDNGDYLHSCLACGFRRITRFAHGRHNCRGVAFRLKRLALGDCVEATLTWCGITKERVQQWTRIADCGCAARQRWLNRWGYKQQERFETMLNAIVAFYFGK